MFQLFPDHLNFSARVQKEMIYQIYKQTKMICEYNKSMTVNYILPHAYLIIIVL